MDSETSGRYGLLQNAIAQQRCVILDGGVATDLPHRHSQGHERCEGLRHSPQTLMRCAGVHRNYAEAGADVIATNTWSLPR
jgi:methionine synthase I (cobalamin-dependent)